MAGKKQYTFGEKKFIKLNKDIVHIVDGVKDRKIEVPAKRWKCFNTCIDEIDSAVNKYSTPEPVSLKIHFGGAWNVIVKTGIPCVNIRKFFVPHGTTEEKPTRNGVTIKLSDWPAFKQAINQLHTDHPKLTQVQLCFEQLDHCNQIGAFNCQECFPYARFVAGEWTPFLQN